MVIDLKPFGYAVCFSVILNIKDISNGENQLVQIKQVRQRDTGYHFYVFYKHSVPDEPPYFLPSFPPSHRLWRLSIVNWNVDKQQTQNY